DYKVTGVQTCALPICNLAVLVLVEVSEIGIGQGSVGSWHRREFGLAELSVSIAVRQGECPVGKGLPFVASKDAVAIGAPCRGPRSEERRVGKGGRARG